MGCQQGAPACTSATQHPSPPTNQQASVVTTIQNCGTVYLNPDLNPNLNPNPKSTWGATLKA